jgi:hypothetical protein
VVSVGYFLAESPSFNEWSGNFQFFAFWGANYPHKSEKRGDLFATAREPHNVAKETYF